MVSKCLSSHILISFKYETFFNIVLGLKTFPKNCFEVLIKNTFTAL